MNCRSLCIDNFLKNSVYSYNIVELCVEIVTDLVLNRKNVLATIVNIGTEFEIQCTT